MPQTVYHVVPNEGRWAVKREGVEFPHRVVETQAAAVEAAQRLLRFEAPGRIVVHGSDGAIERVHAYDEPPPAPVSAAPSWRAVVFSKPALAVAGAAFLVALGWGLSRRD
ncbi:MAG: DUF2188 domain-containing protein [Bacteroidota bacterium]